VLIWPTVDVIWLLTPVEALVLGLRVDLDRDLAVVAGHAGVGDVVAGGRETDLGRQQTAFADAEETGHGVLLYLWVAARISRSASA
jgi:hypothetical protein